MAAKTERKGTRRMLCHYTLDGKPLIGPVGGTDHLSSWVDVPWPDTVPPDEVPLHLREQAGFAEKKPGGALARIWWALAYRLGWRPLR